MQRINRLFKLIILIIMFLFIPFFMIVKANTTDDVRVLITSKNPKGVKHFGTYKDVLIPKNYNVALSEMRGVWVATVYNIAIQKQKGITEEDINNYKKEFLEILDRMDEFGMNTLFFQVRPSNDAFYKSSLNPWSKFLLAEGKDPMWDPLEWMIEATHKRGFSFMCWMNAFRVTTESYVTQGTAEKNTIDDLVKMKHEALNNLADENFAKTHPEYVLAGLYDEKLILNPSEPAVQKFIVDTIMEIVENYDVDGLHFDDYFYLNGSGNGNKETQNFSFVGYDGYTQKGQDIMNDVPNYLEYQKNPQNYGKDVFSYSGIYGMEEGLTLGDFRRENINIMMRNIRYKIDEYNKRTNKNVEFGTKPAAVWRSNIEYCSTDSTRCAPNGSNTYEYAYSTYCDLFADSLKWVEEGLVDWVAPQIYYSFEDDIAPYADIVDWWSEQVRRINKGFLESGKKLVKLYTANGLYKYRDKPNEFYRAAEISDQIRYNKHYSDVLKGCAFYSYEVLYKTIGENILSSYPNAEKIRNGGVKQLKALFANNRVFPLEVGSVDFDNLKVEEYRIKETLDDELILKFNVINNARAYGIYKVNKGETLDVEDVSKRINVIYSGYEQMKTIEYSLGEKSLEYDYYIVVVSNNGYISKVATKLDLTKAIKNSAPNQTNIDLDITNKEIKIGSLLKGSFVLPNDVDGDKVSYEIKVVEGTRERNIKTNTYQIDNKIMFEWETFLYDASNCKIRVKFFDGELTTICESTTFDIVEYFQPKPATITFDENIVLSGTLLKGTYIPSIDENGFSLTNEYYLVIDEKEIKIDELTNTIDLLIPLDTLTSSAYIKIITNNGVKMTTTISDVFSIIKNEKPTGGKIILEKTSIKQNELLRGSITLMTDINNTPVVHKLYLVIGDKKEEINIVDNTFEILIPNTEESMISIELVGCDNVNTTTITTSINVLKEEKKGCKKKISIVLLFSITTLFASSILLYRKNTSN